MLIRIQFVLNSFTIPVKMLCLWVNIYSRFNQINGKRWKSTRKIEKLLIANRGEIACRIIRTSRRLGIQTVAVYSEADSNALHVEMADEAYKLGPSPASESYLLATKILEIASKSRCQAIHPGYGFLSENHEFADDCQKSGLIFIGPPASAIRNMGIKSTSKAIMETAGVPVIKGYHGTDQTEEKLRAEALKIGYPVMIKAVRGGGGKGMRIARSESEFKEALDSARSEAKKSFGDSVVLLEKFVDEPRHVEVQVFGDLHGNVVHLFERDCSIQRRHQKIIEEAPAPGITEDVRQKLGTTAVLAAKAVGYVGAGTVEFILDRRNLDFYFMEMNTRLQVEHPITEMITGLDLVEWQLKVASGQELPEQHNIKLNGHSFEARIYAENPENNFLPAAGPLVYLSTPRDCRIETGVRQNDQVSVYYDPMIAKLVVWGMDRSEALLKLQSKLLKFHVAGLETNINFLLDLVRHPEFFKGNVHTNFIRDNKDGLFIERGFSEKQKIQSVLAVISDEKSKDVEDLFNPFKVEAGFRPNYRYIREFNLKFKEKDLSVKVKYLENDKYSITTNGGTSWSLVEGSLINNSLKCTINNYKMDINISLNNDTITIFDENGKTEVFLKQPKFLSEKDNLSSSVPQDKAVTPMPGILDKLYVKAGQEVKKGDSLFVLIAMKMEYVVKSNRDGVVSQVFQKVGDNVAKDAIIVQFQ